MPKPFMNILHLSDLQAGANCLARLPLGLLHDDKLPVSRRLEHYADVMARDVSGCLARKGFGTVDVIALTGDVAERATVDEYDEATIFLERLVGTTGVAWRNVAIVPGNHDVSWSDLKKACPPPKKGRKFNAVKCAGYKVKMANFANWLNALYRKHKVSVRYHFGQPILFAASNARIVGLDVTEALTYAHNGSTNRPVISQRQLDAATAALKCKKRVLRIAIMHHNPFPNPDEPKQSGLQDEQRVLQALQAAGAHLILAGHMHRGRTVIHVIPGTGDTAAVPTLVTGPCCMRHPERTFAFGQNSEVLPNRYQLISVNRQNGSVVNQFRRLSMEKLEQSAGCCGDWTADTDLAYANRYGERALSISI